MNHSISKPRILQDSQIDIIIGLSTIKIENLALKIPSRFFQDASNS
jgi:hypothetical protein